MTFKPSRRDLLTGLVGASLAGLVAATLPVGSSAAAADINTPMLSGLAWRSGSNTAGFSCLAQLRSRVLDAVVTFVPSDQGFARMINFTAGAYWRGQARKAPLVVVSLPLLTEETQGQFAQCAAGARSMPPGARSGPTSTPSARRAWSSGWAGRRTSAPRAIPGASTPPNTGLFSSVTWVGQRRAGDRG
jgi:hypothetical protein